MKYFALLSLLLTDLAFAQLYNYKYPANNQILVNPKPYDSKNAWGFRIPILKPGKTVSYVYVDVTGDAKYYSSLFTGSGRMPYGNYRGALINKETLTCMLQKNFNQLNAFNNGIFLSGDMVTAPSAISGKTYIVSDHITSNLKIGFRGFAAAKECLTFELDEFTTISEKSGSVIFTDGGTTINSKYFPACILEPVYTVVGEPVCKTDGASDKDDCAVKVCEKGKIAKEGKNKGKCVESNKNYRGHSIEYADYLKEAKGNISEAYVLVSPSDQTRVIGANFLVTTLDKKYSKKLTPSCGLPCPQDSTCDF